jgi:WD40-like Beta Propeller Repeat
MRPGVITFFGILLGGVLLAQQALTQQPTPAKKPLTPAPAFVPLPKDMQCSLQGVSFTSVVGARGQMENTNGTVESVGCWIVAKGEDQKKYLPLASNEIAHDIITTKDFGRLKITPENSVTSAGFSLAIRADAIRPLRAFLLHSLVASSTATTSAPIYSGAVASSTTEMRDLLVIPKDEFTDSLAVSDDGKHLAYISSENGDCRVVFDGVPSQAFSKCTQPIISPANTVYFWAAGNGSIVLSANGTIIPTTLSSQGNIVFSKDGARWVAYGAEKGTQSGDTLTRGAIAVYADGTLLGKYGDMSTPAFSSDGKHVAFISFESSEMSLVVDGKVARSFGQPSSASSFRVQLFANGPNLFMETSVHYLRGGDTIALVQDANGWTVYKQNQVLKTYAQNVLGGNGYRVMSFKGYEDASSIQASSLVVADDASVAAWWERPAGKDAKWRVVLDGKPADSIECPDFWSSKPPVPSRDGKHLAYAAEIPNDKDKDKDVYVIVDGTQHGPFTNAGGIRFSEDGKHVAWAASEGGDGDTWSYYLDGRTFGAKYESVYPPVFSANGRHIAWQAKQNKKSVLVVDGGEIATTEAVEWGPQVLDSGTTRWVAREGTKVFEIDSSLK